MTAQFPDTIWIDGQEYAIAAVDGQGLFEPADHGILPVATVTACWRGYVCQYKNDHERLVLEGLQVSLGSLDPTGRFAPAAGPVLNGVRPQLQDDRRALFSNVYSHLGLPVAFTGSLQAGRDFIQALYMHFGFHPPWKYQTVIELTCQQGRICEVRDISARCEAIRNSMRPSGG